MRALDCQVDYWNRVGPSKSFHHPVNFERLGRWVSTEDPILDYGCGYGRALALLRDNGYSNLTGVDPAPAMIAEATRRLPGVRLACCTDPARVDLPDGCAGAVLLFTVLTCIPTDEGQETILREITRLLKPRGLLYISDLWLQSDARNVERYERDRAKYGNYGVFDLAEGVTVRHHDPEWISRLTAGYHPVALDHLEVETMNGHRASAFQWFGLRASVSRS